MSKQNNTVIIFPKKCVVDTNVLLVANQAVKPDPNLPVPDCLVNACIKVIEDILNSIGIVIDAGDEILHEYSHKLSWSGQPGVGDAFFKWIGDYQYQLPPNQRVNITPCGDSYLEFPNDKRLTKFDPSDRKFVAVSNAHPEKPPILNATDSDWKKAENPLKEHGIKVISLCPDFIDKTCRSKKK